MGSLETGSSLPRRGRLENDAANHRVAGPCAHLIGSIIDLDYTNFLPNFPSVSGEYRVKVQSYDQNTGWYMVDSAGLSLEDGEAFVDEVDLSKMVSEGRVKVLAPANSFEPTTMNTASTSSKRPGRGEALAGAAKSRKIVPFGEGIVGRIVEANL